MSKFKSSAILNILAIFVISLEFVISIKLGITGNLDQEWAAFKQKFGKYYPTNSGTTEAYARYYWTYNRRLIDIHNLYYNRGLRTFRLRENQFTDMRLASFNLLFPVVTTQLNVPLYTPNAQEIESPSFDPREDFGLNTTIGDQGTVCNSGWAYATAKAIEIFQAYRMNDLNPAELSAQNLIDCAGQSRGCRNQVPQAGFDYLTVYGQELHTTSSYPNDKTQAQQGMCRLMPGSNLPPAGTVSVTLRRYASLRNGDDTTLRRVVPTKPTVIEFNPTSFEFMHYGGGIFQQPATYRGSHFMTVIGYGRNNTANLNYFIVQNSFGRDWGENGTIRISYTTARPLTKSALLPVE